MMEFIFPYVQKFKNITIFIKSTSGHFLGLNSVIPKVHFKLEREFLDPGRVQVSFPHNVFTFREIFAGEVRTETLGSAF